MIFAGILLAAIELAGVTGTDLRARAFFDCNNVKVGDPMTLTVDFIGNADFAALHPPHLARELDAKVWKLDQASAKTETVDGARRVTYRVRPLKSGVLWLPAIEFTCGDLRFSSNPVPVHAKAGSSVAIDLESENAYPPMPDPPEGAGDEWFELCRLTHQGDYAGALRRLSAMAWARGQTPDVEAAMVAVRARRLGDPDAELPAWRVVARPLVKYPWPRQCAIVISFVLAVAVSLLLLGKSIKHFAAVATVVVTLSTPELKVGEPFEFLLAVQPQGQGEISVQQITPSDSYGLSWIGKPVKTDEHHWRLPARFDVPIANPAMMFRVSGMVTERREISRAGFHMVSTSSNSFAADSAPLSINVRPLDPSSQPGDFSGIVAENLRFVAMPDSLNVGTNDVITVTYRLMLPAGGFVPRGYLPRGAAYDWGENEWKGYFVADGAQATPDSEICYYNPKTKTYCRAQAGGMAINYHE